MKRIFCIITAVLIALAAVDFPVSAADTALSKADVSLPVDYFTTVSVSGAKGNAEWSTGNKDVAQVEAGRNNSADIIGIGEGETYIYAKADGKTLRCKVTVKQSFISVSSQNVILDAGDSKTVKLAVTGDCKLTLKNSDKKVCSTSWGKRNNGISSLTVTAKSSGTAKITVFAKDHAETTAQTITVKVNDTDTISLESSSETDSDDSVSLIKDVYPVSERAVEPEFDAEAYEKAYNSLCDEMNKIIKAYSYKCSVLVESKANGRLFSYNTKEYMPGGCTIKVPYVYYCCTQLEQGKHSLDEKVTYQSRHYVGGSGKIRYEQYGKTYTIEELIDLALRISDNVAYYMLVDVFGKQEFNQMVQNWGYSSVLPASNYPNVSAEFLNFSMLKMYDKKESSKHKSWAVAWNALLKGISTSDIRTVINGKVAIKCGVPSSVYYNEVCFIEGKAPYTLVIMSKSETYEGDAEFFKSIAKCAEKLVALNQTSVTANVDKEVYSQNCAATIERFAISKKNPNVASPIEYKIDNANNSIYVDLTYSSYADIYTLSDCIVDVSVKNGSFSFKSGSVGTSGGVNLTKPAELVVADSNGLKKKYTVTTKRTVYDLPIVNVYLENNASVDSIDRNNYTAMTFSIDTTGDKSFQPTAVSSGRIRGRGHSTWKWDKKPYRIKLDKAASVLGLEENKDWILLANYADKSLMRNTVAYDMSRTLDGMDWAPTQYPVDLFINGVYQGVYSIGEHMEIGDGRVDIDEKSEKNDTGFLLEVGGADEPDMKVNIDYFVIPSSKAAVAFKDPDGDELTDGQRKFIVNYVKKADAAIVSGKNYEDYIDVDSFCDWIIIHELTYNLDSCFRRSCYITKDKGGKLKMGPVWDFDLAFGNFSKDNPNYNDWATIGKNTKDAYITENWCTYLMADKSFRSRLRSRWFEVKDKLLSTANKSIDSNSKKIYRSQQENFKVWKIWGTRAGYQPKGKLNYESYELQIKYLKDFISNRAKWIDKNI